MIIIKYLIREILKSQLAILFILLLIFFCQKLVRILEAAVDGEIPTNLILTLLGLGVSEMVKLILPLSLFLAILITIGNLYVSSEITAIHACGLSNGILVKSAMILTLFTSIIAIVNVLWLSPWSSRYQDEVIQKVKANPVTLSLIAGQFHVSNDGNTVLFIESVKGNKFSKVFLAQIYSKKNVRPSIVLADNGYIEQKLDGSHVIILDKGTRFEGTAMLRDFRITDFMNYKALVNHKNTELNFNHPDQVDMTVLLSNKNPQFKAELYWRLTLVFSVFIMALMVIPLSKVNPCYDRALSMLPSMLLYLIFFLLESTLKSNVEKGKYDSIILMWIVNLFYLLLGVILNLWDTVKIRRFRAYFSHKVSFNV